MKTITALREQVIKSLSGIKDDNVSIFDVTIERRKLLEALRLLSEDVLTINYGVVSFESRKRSEYRNEYIVDAKVDNAPCIQIQAERHTMRFLNHAHISRNSGQIVPINFVDYHISAKPEISGVLIEVKELIDAINYSLVDIATDESRQNLRCVLFESEGNTLKLVTADGFRLGTCTLQAKGIGNHNVLVDLTDIKRLMPFLKNIKPIGKGKSKVSPELYISINDTVKFTSGNNTIELAIVDATFPKYQNLIPESIIKVEFIASQLLQTVKSLGSINEHICLKFSHNDYKINLSTHDEEHGDLQAVCDANIEADCRIAFNVKYLKDFLAQCKDSKVTAYLKDESTCCKFVLDNKLQLLMPYFVKWDDEKPAETETIESTDLVTA